jgi:hypothetical protein
MLLEKEFCIKRYGKFDGRARFTFAHHLHVDIHELSTVGLQFPAILLILDVNCG